MKDYNIDVDEQQSDDEFNCTYAGDNNNTNQKFKEKSLYDKRRLIEELLEEKRLRTELDEYYDDYVCHQRSYHDDDLFSEIYKPDIED